MQDVHVLSVYWRQVQVKKVRNYNWNQTDASDFFVAEYGKQEAVASDLIQALS